MADKYTDTIAASNVITDDVAVADAVAAILADGRAAAEPAMLHQLRGRLGNPALPEPECDAGAAAGHAMRAQSTIMRASRTRHSQCPHASSTASASPMNCSMA